MLLNHYNGISLFFKGLIVKNFRELLSGSFEFELEMPREEQICPYCGQKTNRIKDYRIQKFRDAQAFGENVFIILRKRRYICPHCMRSFTESNPLIHRYQHFSGRFYRLTFKEFQRMQSFSAIASRMGVSVTSIIRWFDRISFGHPDMPTCFSIDEFKGNAEGEKFQCNISDPINHKVLDILPSRTVENLCAHFCDKYTLEQRLTVQNVVMDMSTTFRSAIHKLFPNAKIIADRFHVTRLVNWSLENVRKRIQKQFHKERRRWFKRSKAILLKKEWLLSIEERAVLNRMLAASPELEKAYILKERFSTIFRESNKKATTRSLDHWLGLVAKFNIPEFRHCIDTFTKWSHEITRISEYKVSNGFIEGSNNKIKVLKRVSYGIWNFERFRNRILYLCG